MAQTALPPGVPYTWRGLPRAGLGAGSPAPGRPCGQPRVHGHRAAHPGSADAAPHPRAQRGAPAPPPPPHARVGAGRVGAGPSARGCGEPGPGRATARTGQRRARGRTAAARGAGCSPGPRGKAPRAADRAPGASGESHCDLPEADTPRPAGGPALPSLVAETGNDGAASRPRPEPGAGTCAWAPGPPPRPCEPHARFRSRGRGPGRRPPAPRAKPGTHRPGGVRCANTSSCCCWPFLRLPWERPAEGSG